MIPDTTWCIVRVACRACDVPSAAARISHAKELGPWARSVFQVVVDYKHPPPASAKGVPSTQLHAVHHNYAESRCTSDSSWLDTPELVDCMVAKPSHVHRC